MICVYQEPTDIEMSRVFVDKDKAVIFGCRWETNGEIEYATIILREMDGAFGTTQINVPGIVSFVGDIKGNDVMICTIGKGSPKVRWPRLGFADAGQLQYWSNPIAISMTGEKVELNLGIAHEGNIWGLETGRFGDHGNEELALGVYLDGGENAIDFYGIDGKLIKQVKMDDNDDREVDGFTKCQISQSCDSIITSGGDIVRDIDGDPLTKIDGMVPWRDLLNMALLDRHRLVGIFRADFADSLEYPATVMQIGF